MSPLIRESFIFAHRRPPAESISLASIPWLAFLISLTVVSTELAVHVGMSKRPGRECVRVENARRHLTAAAIGFPPRPQSTCPIGIAIRKDIAHSI